MKAGGMWHSVSPASLHSVHLCPCTTVPCAPACQCPVSLHGVCPVCLCGSALCPCRHFSPECWAALLQPRRDRPPGDQVPGSSMGRRGQGHQLREQSLSAGQAVPAPSCASCWRCRGASPEARQSTELRLPPAARSGLGLARAAQGEAKLPRAERQPQKRPVRVAQAVLAPPLALCACSGAGCTWLLLRGTRLSAAPWWR